MAEQKGSAGRYDAECERVLLTTGAEVVILLVIGGSKGNGFSASAQRVVTGAEAAAILRAYADVIDGAPPDGMRIERLS